MKIGITERGDAGIDLTWLDEAKKQEVDGVILITKHITDEFIEKVLALYSTFPQIIVHCTCTGWGGTPTEPNVPTYTEQLNQLNKLLSRGFPKSHCVLRVDPIFATEKGIKRVEKVLAAAFKMGLLPDMRVRISIFDEYNHVKARFRQAGLLPMYGSCFQSPQPVTDTLIEALRKYKLQYECCAEPQLQGECFKHVGCVSSKDIEIMGIDTADIPQSVNCQNRTGCLCLSCKTELLKNKHRCPHQCLYCYWKD